MVKKGQKKVVGGDITDLLPKDGKKSIFAAQWIPGKQKKRG
jgi:hypothetical protein